MLCAFKGEILNAGRELFKDYLDVLIAYKHQLVNCQRTNEKINQHNVVGVAIADGLAAIVRSHDHGLYALVLQLDPLTSFRRNKNIRVTGKCSKAVNSVDFEHRLSRMTRGLIDFLQVVKSVLQPAVSRCRSSRGTHRPRDVIDSDVIDNVDESRPAPIGLWLTVASIAVALLFTVVNISICLILFRRRRSKMRENFTCDRKPICKSNARRTRSQYLQTVV